MAYFLKAISSIDLIHSYYLMQKLFEMFSLFSQIKFDSLNNVSTPALKTAKIAFHLPHQQSMLDF